jgi:hypothetical protein
MAVGDNNGGMATLKAIGNSVAVAAILATGAMVMNTTQTANENAVEIERRQETINAVPKMQTDIEVIKTEQKNQSKEIGEIKEDTRQILNELRRRPQ